MTAKLQLRSYIPASLAFPSIHPRTVYTLITVSCGIILEIISIATNDLPGSIILNSAIFLAIYGELRFQHRSQINSSVPVPVYELKKLHHYAELGRVAGGLVHELANPLTSIMLSLESLRRHNSSPHVERALSSTETMNLYVRAVRGQISGSQANRQFNVRQVLTNIEQMTSYKARQLNVSIKIDCKVDLLFSGNPIRFQQALSNLVNNAIDSYHEHSASSREILVGARKVGKWLRIEIIDGGCGIEEANLAKIFEPFYTTKTLELGTGIGLAITKEIIETELGGHIGVQSQIGKGTTFQVILPEKREKINS